MNEAVVEVRVGETMGHSCMPPVISDLSRCSFQQSLHDHSCLVVVSLISCSMLQRRRKEPLQLLMKQAGEI